MTYKIYTKPSTKNSINFDGNNSTWWNYFLISLLHLGECSPSTWIIGLGQMKKTKCCVTCTWFCKSVSRGFLKGFV